MAGTTTHATYVHRHYHCAKNTPPCVSLKPLPAKSPQAIPKPSLPSGSMLTPPPAALNRATLYDHHNQWTTHNILQPRQKISHSQCHCICMCPFQGSVHAQNKTDCKVFSFFVHCPYSIACDSVTIIFASIIILNRQTIGLAAMSKAAWPTYSRTWPPTNTPNPSGCRDYTGRS